MMIRKNKKVYFFQLNFIFSETSAYGYKHYTGNKQRVRQCLSQFSAPVYIRHKVTKYGIKIFNCYMYSQVLICNTIHLSTMVTWIIMIHLLDISVFINLFSYFLNSNLRAAPWNIFGLVPFLINSMLILQNSLTTEKIQT